MPSARRSPACCRIAGPAAARCGARADARPRCSRHAARRTCWWAASSRRISRRVDRSSCAARRGRASSPSRPYASDELLANRHRHPADRRLCGNLGHVGQRRRPLAERCRARQARRAKRVPAGRSCACSATCWACRASTTELGGRSRRAAARARTGCQAATPAAGAFAPGTRNGVDVTRDVAIYQIDAIVRRSRAAAADRDGRGRGPGRCANDRLDRSTCWLSQPEWLRGSSSSLGQILPSRSCVILCVAYLTLAERKVIGYMQARIGPEPRRSEGPAAAVRRRHQAADEGSRHPVALEPLPVRGCAVAVDDARVCGLGRDVAVAGFLDRRTRCGRALRACARRFGAYGIILAGWATNSKYAFLGAMRSAAQIVAYEIAMGFALVGVVMAARHAEPRQDRRRPGGRAVHWFWLSLFPLFLVYFISGVAETNRAPFDVAEGESEIVAGFHVEYSGMAFALFFLAEYANMILIAALASTFFLGGWLSPFEGYPILGDIAGSAPGLDGSSQDLLFPVLFPVVPRDVSALPLRPDHAPGLEGLHPRDAGLDHGRGGDVVCAGGTMGSVSSAIRSHQDTLPLGTAGRAFGHAPQLLRAGR